MRSLLNSYTLRNIIPFGITAFFLAIFFASDNTLAQDEQLPTREPSPVTQAQNTQELGAFRNAVESLESSGGAYATLLPEQLLSLGLALQKEGRHTEAVDIFKRGAHLARINNGLYSAAQIQHIQNRITSHLAMGQLEEADKNQARLFRVQRRSLGNGQLEVEALLQQAKWQHRAYDLDIGGDELNFSRLIYMWDLNRLALTNIIDREGETSASLLPPLYGMLRAQYLISGHNDHTNTNGSGFNSELSARQGNRRFNNFRAKNYDMGLSILYGIYDIQEAHSGVKSMAAIRAKIMLGDWMLWHGAREAALDVYGGAIGELANLDDAQLHTEELLGVPTALPDLDGVRPLPPGVSAELGNFLVEFGVTRGGRVVDLVRLQETESEDRDNTLEAQARRLMRALRKTKFRPRFAEGEAVTTENIVKAYVIAH